MDKNNDTIIKVLLTNMSYSIKEMENYRNWFYGSMFRLIEIALNKGANKKQLVYLVKLKQKCTDDINHVNYYKLAKDSKKFSKYFKSVIRTLK